jgi:hypothetical protein
MGRIAITSIALCLAAHAHSQGPSHLGLEWPPLPTGCKYLGGGIVDWGVDKNALEPTPLRDTRPWSNTSVSCGDKRFEWLSISMGRNGNQPLWRVVEVLQLPPVPKGYLMTHTDCTLDGQPASLVVIARWKNKKIGSFATHIKHAWLIDVEAQKFQRVQLNRVACSVDEDRD